MVRLCAIISMKFFDFFFFSEWNVFFASDFATRDTKLLLIKESLNSPATNVFSTADAHQLRITISDHCLIIIYYVREEKKKNIHQTNEQHFLTKSSMNMLYFVCCASAYWIGFVSFVVVNFDDFIWHVFVQSFIVITWFLRGRETRDKKKTVRANGERKKNETKWRSNAC